MKKLFLRITCMLALLMALGVVFGGVNASASAATHAELHTTSSQIVTPDIYGANCTNNTVNIFTTNGNDYCFAASGYTPATIPNVNILCGGEYRGEVITSNQEGYALVPNLCYRIGPLTVVSVQIY